MIKFIDGTMLYVLYSERSYLKYNQSLVAKLLAQFGAGTFDEEPLTNQILKFCFDWAADTFLELIKKFKTPQYAFGGVLLTDLIKNDGVSKNFYG